MVRRGAKAGPTAGEPQKGREPAGGRSTAGARLRVDGREVTTPGRTGPPRGVGCLNQTPPGVRGPCASGGSTRPPGEACGRLTQRAQYERVILIGTRSSSATAGLALGRAALRGGRRMRHRRAVTPEVAADSRRFSPARRAVRDAVTPGSGRRRARTRCFAGRRGAEGQRVPGGSTGGSPRDPVTLTVDGYDRLRSRHPAGGDSCSPSPGHIEVTRRGRLDGGACGHSPELDEERAGAVRRGGPPGQALSQTPTRLGAAARAGAAFAVEEGGVSAA